MIERSREAVVIRQDARGCRVRFDDGEERWCSVRGRVHLRGPKTATTTVAVGDRVVVRPEGRERGSVEEILPRTSVLSRPDPHEVRRQHVLAANVDQVVVATAAADPAFSSGFVDRVLAVAEWSRLAAVIVVNKMDLVEAEPPECEAYRRMGYRVVLASARRGDGTDALRDMLTGRVSVVTGHSGVGKSSLLNAVEPGLALKVGLVNVVTGRGRQTTSAAVLVPLTLGGGVIDTPGIREFGLFNVPPREVTWLFRDLREIAPNCRFGDCLHRGEPGCAMLAAVEAGTVAAFRFESYLRLLETVGEVRPWEIAGD
ncbi:MAG TPA: ribosome small subunit-dependent GTPase A [Planctomycetota bacterium]|nr:ribosome small subunit-dependent GTPase A [Planctomycetota bacterium]